MVAERLLAKGMRVRMIRRGDARQSGVEIVSANVHDPSAAADAMRGASVVYHCANPRYHRWPEELVPLATGIVHGAARAGARLVALDNLYMYGVPADGVLRTDGPIAPRSKKGVLRARAAEEMLGAHARGDLPVAIVRASDFVGPHVHNSLFGDRFWQRLFANKAVEAWGDPDQLHTYSYSLDVADALVTIGAASDDAFGRVWHAPALPAETTRAWVERFARAASRTPRLTTLSPTLLRLIGLFLPEAKEIPEMMYQWETPYVLDDSELRARFGASPTPMPEVIDATIAWAERHHLARAAA